MTMHAGLASLVGRGHRKALAAAAVFALLVIVALANGIGSQGDGPAGSVSPRVSTSTGAAGDAGVTSGATRGAAQPAYSPSVDDLTGNTVVYDGGTGDQMDYAPPFDSGS